jgi:hypothetical protein
LNQQINIEAIQEVQELKESKEKEISEAEELLREARKYGSNAKKLFPRAFSRKHEVNYGAGDKVIHAKWGDNTQ